jgi:uncharacterized RDD family membrane protein YckC
MRYDPSVEYAGFWRRLSALLVDALVFSPLLAASIWASSQTRDVYRDFIILNWLIANIYHILCIARWGQTIGKKSAGIRVVRISGERVSWREAFLRNSVDTLLSLASNASTWLAIGALSEADWIQDSPQKWIQIDALRPVWGHWLNVAFHGWILSELIVLLFNKRRRALHDFIAGTVVIKTS